MGVRAEGEFEPLAEGFGGVRTDPLLIGGWKAESGAEVIGEFRF